MLEIAKIPTILYFKPCYLHYITYLTINSNGQEFIPKKRNLQKYPMRFVRAHPRTICISGRGEGNLGTGLGADHSLVLKRSDKSILIWQANIFS